MYTLYIIKYPLFHIAYIIYHFDVVVVVVVVVEYIYYIVVIVCSIYNIVLCSHWSYNMCAGLSDALGIVGGDEGLETGFQYRLKKTEKRLMPAVVVMVVVVGGSARAGGSSGLSLLQLYGGCSDIPCDRFLLVRVYNNNNNIYIYVCLHNSVIRYNIILYFMHTGERSKGRENNVLLSYTHCTLRVHRVMYITVLVNGILLFECH